MIQTTIILEETVLSCLLVNGLSEYGRNWMVKVNIDNPSYALKANKGGILSWETRLNNREFAALISLSLCGVGEESWSEYDKESLYKILEPRFTSCPDYLKPFP